MWTLWHCSILSKIGAVTDPGAIQPGFLTARFVRSLDGKTGVGTVIFDTEDNAKAALDGMMTQRPAQLPPV